MVTGVSPAAAPGGAVRAVELAIGGMTCASCAARVEKKLNKLDGITATVNFATETARVSFPAAMPATDLISVVEQAGYTAALPAPPGESAGGAAEEDGAGETSVLRKRLLVSLALAIPAVALAMISPLQFRNWQRASLERGSGTGAIYLDVAAGVTVLILLGRYLAWPLSGGPGEAARGRGVAGA